MLLRRLRDDLPGRGFRRLRYSAPLAIADVTVTGLWAVTGRLRKPTVPAGNDRPLTLTVSDRQIVAHDQNVVALTLVAADGSTLPAWHPGAHLDIRLPSGRMRQYSLCGDTSQRTAYRIAVRRIPDGGGGSVEVHDALMIGSTVSSTGPRNAFPLSVPGYGSPSRRIRFIAGGIGITPILPMLVLVEQLSVDWSMIYVGRSAESIPFLDEVLRFGDRIEIRTDDVHGLPSADVLLGECLDGTTVYACGPAAMLATVSRQLTGRTGVELHVERFAAAPVLDGEEFTVTVSSGRQITVPAGETLLAALRRNGVDAAYSCQQGFCGTCRARVTEGAVQHRDSLLTDSERDSGMMLTCVSRAARGQNLHLDL